MSGNRAAAGGVGAAARRRAVAAAFALFAAGCAASPAGAPPPAPVAPPPPAAAPVTAPAPVPAAPAPAPVRSLGPRFPDPADPQWITARIAELEAARKKGPDADGALALELALLYSHPANPSTNHVKALAAMRAYLALAPAGSREPLVLAVAGLLEDIEHLGKIARDARVREKELTAMVKGLEQSAAEGEQRDAAAKKREQELLAQIATLQQRIKQLQQLDLEMERRRRSVK